MKVLKTAGEVLWLTMGCIMVIVAIPVVGVMSFVCKLTDKVGSK